MCEKRGKIFRRKFHRSKKNRCPRIREKGGRRLHTKESWGNFLVEFDVKIVERFTTRPPTLLRFVPFFLLFSWTIVHSCAASTRRHKPRETRNKSATRRWLHLFPFFSFYKNIGCCRAKSSRNRVVIDRATTLIDIFQDKSWMSRRNKVGDDNKTRV